MSTEETPVPDVAKLPLKALGLRTGMALQTRRLVEGASKKESQFFGAIEGKGVMVGPLGTEGEETGLEEGEVCVVRGFTGQYEFSFLSKVLQTFTKPFVYALLAYPSHTDARVVRQSMRTRANWPTTVQLPKKAGAASSPPMEVALVDISTAGAMIKAAAPLGIIGETVTVRMKITFDSTPIELKLAAKICHNNKAGSENTFCIGMAFTKLTQNDKLVLHYMTQPPQS